MSTWLLVIWRLANRKPRRIKSRRIAISSTKWRNIANTLIDPRPALRKSLRLTHSHILANAECLEVKEYPPWRNFVFFRVILFSVTPPRPSPCFERCHVDHEAIADVAFLHTFVSFVHLLNRNYLDVRCDVVLCRKNPAFPGFP